MEDPSLSTGQGRARGRRKQRNKLTAEGVSRLECPKNQASSSENSPCPSSTWTSKPEVKEAGSSSSPGEILVAKAENYTVQIPLCLKRADGCEEWHTVSTQGLLPCSSKETVLGKAGCELSQPGGCWEGNSSTALAPVSNLWTLKLLDRECVSGRMTAVRPQGWKEEFVLGPASPCYTIQVSAW